MNKTKLFVLLASPLLPFALSQAQTILLAEDFADFSEGNIHGQNGWTVSGGSETQHQIETTGGLSFESGPVSHLGGDNLVRIDGGSEQYASVNFGAQSGESLYLSFLFNRDGGNFFMLGFTEGDLPASGGEVAGAGGRFSSNAVSARIGSNVFASGTRDEVGEGIAHGSETILYVGKLFKSGESGDNYDRFAFAVNPASLSEPSEWAFTGEFDTGLASVDTLWFRGGGEASTDFAVDVLRVGTSYDAVVIPEPSTYAALVGLLALAFAAYRRRR